MQGLQMWTMTFLQRHLACIPPFQSSVHRLPLTQCFEDLLLLAFRHSLRSCDVSQVRAVQRPTISVVRRRYWLGHRVQVHACMQGRPSSLACSSMASEPLRRKRISANQSGTTVWAVWVRGSRTTVIACRTSVPCGRMRRPVHIYECTPSSPR